jgi:hypothetical protein
LKAELYAATVKFYETLNESYKTLDTSPVRELVTEDCGACKAYIDSVDSTREAGQRHADVGEYIIEDFAVAKHPIGGDYQTVTFELSHTGLRVLDADGNEIRKAERKTFEAMIDFVRRDGRWLVAEQYLE